MSKIAIVAALAREIRPLVKGWRTAEREYDGKRFKFFENGKDAVLVCGGIGPEAARRASEAVIALYSPETLQSAGFAGALDSTLKVGDIFSPARLIDAKDGSSVESDGNGVLISFASIAGASQKEKLARAYGAQAVDMEAAAVAGSASSHGIKFTVTKVISDEFGFEIPGMDGFVSREGRFHSGRFLAFAAVRPWLWARVVGLGQRSAKAANALCRELARQLSAQGEKTPELDPSLRV
jgi:adenosylhomocysteine nucleosidase